MAGNIKLRNRDDGEKEKGDKREKLTEGESEWREKAAEGK